MNDIRRIMVLAMDIKHSRETVRYGVSLARKYGAELVVLHVEHDPFGAHSRICRFCPSTRNTRNCSRKQRKTWKGSCTPSRRTGCR